MTIADQIAAPAPSARNRAGRWVLATAVVAVHLAAVPLPTGRVCHAATGSTVNLLVFTPRNAESLARNLDHAWQAPRPTGTLPNLAPDSFPEGMDNLPTEVKKRTFLRALAPHVVAANLWIANERRYLNDVLRNSGSSPPPGGPKRACLLGMARRYRADLGTDGDTLGEQTLSQLHQRVDVVPAGLALAQAAIESGWGASRFARLGNNLFGQWVFSADKGIVPKERPEGANYSVARFDGLGQSLGAYLYNLNTFWAYQGLREIRTTLREGGRQLDSMVLADGLKLYSERREAYVEDVRLVMQANDLHRFDNLAFSPLSAEEWLLRLEGEPDLRVGGLLAPFVDPAILSFQAGGRPAPPEG